MFLLTLLCGSCSSLYEFIVFFALVATFFVIIIDVSFFTLIFSHHVYCSSFLCACFSSLRLLLLFSLHSLLVFIVFTATPHHVYCLSPFCICCFSSLSLLLLPSLCLLFLLFTLIVFALCICCYFSSSRLLLLPSSHLLLLLFTIVIVRSLCLMLVLVLILLFGMLDIRWILVLASIRPY